MLRRDGQKTEEEGGGERGGARALMAADVTRAVGKGKGKARGQQTDVAAAAAAGV